MSRNELINKILEGEKLVGRPVRPMPKFPPFCAVTYKGKRYHFVAVDEEHCQSPLTGELLLRHQIREYYMSHVHKTLKQFPDLAK